MDLLPSMRDINYSLSEITETGRIVSNWIGIRAIYRHSTDERLVALIKSSISQIKEYVMQNTSIDRGEKQSFT